MNEKCFEAINSNVLHLDYMTKLATWLTAKNLPRQIIFTADLMREQ